MALHTESSGNASLEYGLAQVCGVLLLKPTIVVYAISRTFTLPSDTRAIMMPVSHYGTAEVVVIARSSIAFMEERLNMTSILADVVDMPGSYRAENILKPRIYGKLCSEPIVCQIKPPDLSGTIAAASTYKATPRPTYEPGDKERTQSIRQSLDSIGGLSPEIAPQMVLDSAFVLRSRLNDGLRLETKKWTGDDFVVAYATYVKMVNAFGLATLPLPELFADSMQEDLDAGVPM